MNLIIQDFLSLIQDSKALNELEKKQWKKVAQTLQSKSEAQEVKELFCLFQIEKTKQDRLKRKLNRLANEALNEVWEIHQKVRTMRKRHHLTTNIHEYKRIGRW